MDYLFSSLWTQNGYSNIFILLIFHLIFMKYCMTHSLIKEEIIVSPSGREQKVVRKKEVQKTPLE